MLKGTMPDDRFGAVQARPNAASDTTRTVLDVHPGKLRLAAPGSEAMLLAADETCLDMLPTAEAELIANAAQARQIQFAAGRAAARGALRKLGKSAAAIPIGSMREPLWPTQIVGSITHAEHCALVWVARRTDYAGLGVDVQPIRQLPDRAWSMILSEYEQFWTKSWADRQPVATALCSVKESIYKAVFPTVRRFVDFNEVELAFDQRGDRLIAHPASRLAAELEGMQLHADFTIGRKSVMSWAVLAAAESD